MDVIGIWYTLPILVNVKNRLAPIQTRWLSYYRDDLWYQVKHILFLLVSIHLIIFLVLRLYQAERNLCLRLLLFIFVLVYLSSLERINPSYLLTVVLLFKILNQISILVLVKILIKVWIRLIFLISLYLLIKRVF